AAGAGRAAAVSRCGVAGCVRGGVDCVRGAGSVLGAGATGGGGAGCALRACADPGRDGPAAPAAVVGGRPRSPTTSGSSTVTGAFAAGALPPGAGAVPASATAAGGSVLPAPACIPCDRQAVQ